MVGRRQQANNADLRSDFRMGWFLTDETFSIMKEIKMI
jgi:hypothetical protein